MMSEAQEKELDKLSRKIISKAGLETPPKRLKQNIMQAVAQANAYSPQKNLLSTKAKMAFGVFVLGFFILLGLLPQSNWTMGLDGLNGMVNQLSAQIPKTFFYGILAFGILLTIQIVYLRHRIYKN